MLIIDFLQNNQREWHCIAYCADVKKLLTHSLDYKQHSMRCSWCCSKMIRYRSATAGYLVSRTNLSLL